MSETSVRWDPGGRNVSEKTNQIALLVLNPRLHIGVGDIAHLFVHQVRVVCLGRPNQYN